MLCPIIILHTWLIPVNRPTKAELWLSLGTISNQRSLTIGLHLKNKLETQYICGRCQLATTTWLISYIIPQRKANKRKLKDINMQPIGLGNTSMLRFCPKSPLNIAPHYHETKSKLILKSGKPKRLIRLKVHQDGFKTSNSQ